jgi:hypothetical protein
MTYVEMNTIELARVGDDVTITLRREVGQLTRARRMATPKALAMSLLLTSKAQEVAVNYKIDLGIGLQIINAPYDCAWLFMDDCRDGTKLVACLEGDVIRHIGQRLRQLSLAGKHSSSNPIKPRTFRVGNCYLEE